LVDIDRWVIRLGLPLKCPKGFASSSAAQRGATQPGLILQAPDKYAEGAEGSGGGGLRWR